MDGTPAEPMASIVEPWGDEIPRLSKSKSIAAAMVLLTDQLYRHSRECDCCSRTGKKLESQANQSSRHKKVPIHVNRMREPQFTYPVNSSYEMRKHKSQYFPPRVRV